jgi:hypothetical protein
MISLFDYLQDISRYYNKTEPTWPKELRHMCDTMSQWAATGATYATFYEDLETIALAEAWFIKQGFSISICSGRSESESQITITWG